MLQRDEQEIIDIIDAGLEAILSGESSLEDVLKQHPDVAADIRAELGSAIWLASRHDLVAPRPGFLPASKKRVLQRIQQETTSRVQKRGLFGLGMPRLALQFATVLTVLVVIFASMTGVVYAANDTIPGDTLYPAKRLGERVMFTLSFDPVRQIELSAMFATRRVNEAERLISKGDYAAAKAVLGEFEEEVNRVTALLATLDGTNNTQVQALAAELQQTLLEQSQHLDELALSAPPEMQDALAEAEETSTAGAEAALEAANDTGDPTVEDTDLVSDTPASEVTEDPSITTLSTPVPPGVVPLDEPAADDEATPTTDPKIKTPKPTNENRPTKDPDPSSKGGSSSSNEDKPPNPKPSK